MISLLQKRVWSLTCKREIINFPRILTWEGWLQIADGFALTGLYAQTRGYRRKFGRTRLQGAKDVWYELPDTQYIAYTTMIDAYNKQLEVADEAPSPDPSHIE